MEILESLKWTSLGLFILLEDTTMLDALGVWPVSWASTIFQESMKFWFYAILLDIIQNVMCLWGTGQVVTAAPTKEGSKTKAPKKADTAKGDLAKKITLALMDLMIPGSVTGWVKIGAIPLGITALISSVYSLKGIWKRC